MPRRKICTCKVCGDKFEDFWSGHGPKNRALLCGKPYCEFKMLERAEQARIQELEAQGYKVHKVIVSAVVAVKTNYPEKTTDCKVLNMEYEATDPKPSNNILLFAIFDKIRDQKWEEK